MQHDLHVRRGHSTVPLILSSDMSMTARAKDESRAHATAFAVDYASVVSLSMFKSSIFIEVVRKTDL